MQTYYYNTDAVSGEVDADSLHEAFAKVLRDQRITEEQIDDGAKVTVVSEDDELTLSADSLWSLVDSETGECIELASIEQIIESFSAGPEGHILVDGRRCYVAL